MLALRPDFRPGQTMNMLTKVPEAFSESYPAIAPSVPRARLVVTQLATGAGIGGKSLQAVRLAVTEAVTNAVLHAYPPPAEGAFHLTVAVAGDELWVLVTDDGCGYQTPSRRPGLGLGLALIARFSDEFVITQRATGGTEVRMRFPISLDREPAEG
jgi:anti-sigma regulatory factor (Ser/Thr protein kinase)